MEAWIDEQEDAVIYYSFRVAPDGHMVVCGQCCRDYGWLNEWSLRATWDYDAPEPVLTVGVYRREQAEA